MQFVGLSLIGVVIFVETSAADVIAVTLAEVGLVGNTGLGKEGKPARKAFDHKLGHYGLGRGGLEGKLASLEVAVAKGIGKLLA
jgi:hypothetical protein